MQISKDWEIIDLALWNPKENVLVISDLHIGYEEYLQQKGMFLPKLQVEQILKRLTQILERVQPKLLIINGDLKHEFGRVLRQEWKEVSNLIDFILKKVPELILIKGNHDLILGPIAEKKGVKVVKEYILNETTIVHGHQLIVTKAKKIIIGHEHPAISLKEKSKIEKYKCFLKGKWKNKELIVMPSFNPLWEGTDIIREQLLSPFLENISNFELFVVGKEEVFDFGKVKELK